MSPAKVKKTGASAKKAKSAPARAKKQNKPSSKPAKSLKAKAKAAPKAAPKKKVAAKPVKPAAKKAAPPKAAVKKGKPAPKVAPKAKAKPAPAKAKQVAKKVVAAAKPAARAVVTAAKAVASAAATVNKKTPPAVKTTAKTAAVAAAVAAPVARAVAKGAKPALTPPAARAAAEAKKATRRPRTRILSSDSGPIAAWINTTGEKPRPMSFIPAPPRAESPSQIAAPPASSDRLIRPDDLQSLNLPAIRTFPIRVEVEQSVGRTHILVQPNEVTIRPGDGIEWDFRYLGGADTFVDEIVIEFPSDKLFAAKALKSRNPGSARPHRQLSGRLNDNAAKGSIFYTIHCRAFGTELAKTTSTIIVS